MCRLYSFHGLLRSFCLHVVQWIVAQQVLEWTQQILRIGEAFSNAECTSLRDVLARQSGKFFDAFHEANLQVQLFSHALAWCASSENQIARYLWQDCPV